MRWHLVFSEDTGQLRRSRQRASALLALLQADKPACELLNKSLLTTVDSQAGQQKPTGASSTRAGRIGPYSLGFQ